MPIAVAALGAAAEAAGLALVGHVPETVTLADALAREESVPAVLRKEDGGVLVHTRHGTVPLVESGSRWLGPDA